MQGVEEIRHKMGGPAVLDSSPGEWEGSLRSCLWSSAWTGAGGGCNRVLK